MTSTEDRTGDEVARLRAALAARDIDAAAAALRAVPVAVPVADGQPRVALDGDRRALPIFLDMASWQAFGDPSQPTLLGHDRLLALLQALEHVDDVLVDPALPSVMRIPRADVVALLGAPAATAGFEPDEALARRIGGIVGRASLAPGAWAVRRVTEAGAHPAIAVADGVRDADVSSFVGALQGADLPRDLELVQLDAQWTSVAQADWASASVA